MRAHLVWWGALISGLVLQTALFPLFLARAWTPGIPRALVLWVALTGLPRGGPLLPFGAGVALDLASGAPLGYGAVLLLALYAVARPFRGVFFDDQPLLLLPLAVLAPWVEAVAAEGLSWVTFHQTLPWGPVVSVAWRQAVVDALWIPLVFVALELLSGRRPAGRVVT